jgi:divalent metal cation (Fe/Co/Zn/Cd) transporter
MVIRAGWGNTMTSLLELGDVTVDEEIKSKVRQAATKALKGDKRKGLAGVDSGSEIEIRDVHGIKSGQNYLMDLELAAPGAFTVRQISAIEEAVRERVGNKVRGVRRVKVKFVSSTDSSSSLQSDFIHPDVSPRSSPEPEDERDHDHSHTNGNGHVNHPQEHKKHKSR